jgi:hypothetical protein
MEKSNIDIVKNALNKFMNDNPHGYLDLCHDEFYGKIWSGLIEGGDEIKGKEEFVKFMEEMNKKIITKKFEPVNWSEVGNTVYFTVNWEFIWKETNTLIRTSANVRKVIRNGKISEKYHLINYNDVAKQLGAVNPDLVLTGDIKNFGEWFNIFSQHSDSKILEINGNKYTPKKSRNEFVDEIRTEVWRDIDHPNHVAVTCFEVDVPALESFMTKDEAMINMTTDFGWEINPPLELKEMIPELSKDEEDIFCFMNVEDSDKWISGFREHSTSKVISGFEAELSVTRSEFCDEEKTRIFKHAKIPNRVAFLLHKVKTKVLGQFMADKNMNKLTKFLGELESTKIIKTVNKL